MKKINIQIPNVKYLSEWSDLDASLPPGKIIVNKIVCGCGMTDYYLTNDKPVILASPRRELIVSKTQNPRTAHVHYFDRSDATIDIKTSIEALRRYVFNPFRDDMCAPKIMCTYDSLPVVINTLSEDNYLDCFTIIGDEATCIFTDARLKGAKWLDLVNLIDAIPNRCVFITATPLKEVYLDQVPVFNTMTYVSFDWQQARLEQITLKRQKMTDTKSAVSDIIQSFRTLGYFQSKIIDGKEMYSTEAVFFLNSVKDIIAIVRNNGLSNKDTRVVCAENKENSRSLKKVGLHIGHFPSVQEYQKSNKTFTFVTRASFEGADLYSDTCSIYVFADSNRETLSLDISIDLPQIIGRCRTVSNPFRHDIRYYYKTTDSESFDIDVAKDEVQAKIDKSNRQITKMNGCDDPDIIEKFIDAQKSQQYRKDYVDVITNNNGTCTLALNSLVILSDLRAIEIKHEQYRSNYSVLCYLKSNGYNAMDYHAQGNTPFAEFYRRFDNAGSFTERMQIYSEYCIDPAIRNEAKKVADIPRCYNRYFEVLGPDKCRALKYREADIRREYDFVNASKLIREKLEERISPGAIIAKAELKVIIQAVYDSLGLCRTAKASDVMAYFPESIEAKLSDQHGKRVNAFKIL